MSPEQARGKAVDKRADIWAFGCVLYEMFTGKRAFEGAEISDVLASVLPREPDWTILPRQISPVLGTVLKQCLHKDRQHRMRDIGDVGLDRENPHAELPTEQFEVVAIRGDHGRPMPSRRQSDERVVLEVSALAAIPVVRIAQCANEAARLPPIALIRRPWVTRQRLESRDGPLRWARARSAPQLGQHYRRITNDEGPPNPLECLIVEAVLPVADVHTCIDDRPHGITGPRCSQA